MYVILEGSRVTKWKKACDGRYEGHRITFLPSNPFPHNFFYSCGCQGVSKRVSDDLQRVRGGDEFIILCSSWNLVVTVGIWSTTMRFFRIRGYMRKRDEMQARVTNPDLGFVHLVFYIADKTAHPVLRIGGLHPWRQRFGCFNQKKLPIGIVHTGFNFKKRSSRFGHDKKRTNLIMASHFELISFNNQTVHHSSSMESPTLILPSKIHDPVFSGFGTTFTSNESRCQIKPDRRESTKFRMHAAKAIAEALSDASEGR